MAAATVFASAASNPGGTGSTLTVTLSTHAADDYLIFFVENTGNTLWAGNPAGWGRIDQRTVGTAANGIVQTWLWKKAVSSSETNPVCTLGATVTRGAICWTVRGADLEGAFSLLEWGARGFATGTSNPVRPPSVTTLAPDMLVLIGYGSRAATNAPDQTNYTQDQEIVISGTLVLNASQRTVADPLTVLSNQDASPTSGARWAAGILCIPSPDYVYFRSGTQALTASGTSVTPALPTGTSSSDTSTRKDLIVATVEAAGTPTISPNTGADWTEITGFATTTSGNGTTVRKYWALYDGSLDRQFNRSSTGEIAATLTTYRNCDQTTPIGGVNVQQNASSTTSTWPALVRTETKSTVTATCVADGTPTFTVSAMTERMDGNGITAGDRSFNAGGTVASASFTLSTASPTACGLVELLSHAGAASFSTFTASVAIDGSAAVESSGVAFSVFERSAVIDASASVAVSGQRDLLRSVSVSATGAIEASGARAIDRAASLSASAAIETAAESFSIFERSVTLDGSASVETSAESFSVAEASVALDGAGTITVSGVREVSRSISFTATAAIESSAQFFSIAQAAVLVTATGSIEATGISLLERQSQVNATASIVVSGQTEQSRQIAIDASASITVSGIVIPPGAVEHERSAALDAAGTITASAEFFSILTSSSEVSATALITVSGQAIQSRLVMLEATGAIIAGHQRELQRSAQLAASGVIEVAGAIGGAIAHERSVFFTGQGSITVTVTVFIPRGTINIEQENRTIEVSIENRSTRISFANDVH